MSTHICGCDPEYLGIGWHCRDYPNCTWGRCENPGLGKPTLTDVKESTVNQNRREPSEYADTSAAEALLVLLFGDEMTLNAYQQSIERTYKPEHLACHGLGLSGEQAEVADLIDRMCDIADRDRSAAKTTGRVCDAIKKQLFHGIEANRDDMRKELGNLLWYLAAVATDFGFTLEEVAQANIDKLAKRYPRGFEKGGGVRGPENSAMNDSLAKAIDDAREARINAARGPVAGRPEGEDSSLDGPEPGAALMSDTKPCTLNQPVGFRCTRSAHIGPCALRPSTAPAPVRPEFPVVNVSRETFNALRRITWDRQVQCGSPLPTAEPAYVCIANTKFYCVD